MPEDHEQIVVRRKKLQALRERGIDPYPNDFRPDHTTAEVHARLSALGEAELARAGTLSIAGRVMAVRDFGKAGFLQVQDRAGRLQVHARRDRLGDEGFEVYRLLDLGDVIGVGGRPFRTRTGELTLEATALRLLAKALRPLPEKWHGLQDVETRYRQRYLDLIVNPEARRIFEVRARAVRYLRDFLVARGYLEVETPMMQPIAGGAAARPFVTHHDAPGRVRRPSPRGGLRNGRGAAPRPADLRHPVPARALAARAPQRPRPALRRPLRALRGASRDRQRLLRAERPRGSARALRGAAPRARGGRRRGARHGRGLPARARARAAAHGRGGRRHRPPGHAAHRCDIDPQMAGAVVDLERHLESGTLAALAHPYPITLPPEEGGTKVELPGLLIGAELARQLGVGTGDVVNLISPLGTPGPAGVVPRIKRFVVAGLFDSGMFDYDTTLAYMALPDAQRFFDLKGAVTGIEVRVRSVYDARAVARAIEAALGGFPYRARDWMEVNRNLFSALKLEKVVYGIVLCLIVVVAAFNILASLTMVVKEKRRDIAILKSMGGASGSIARIFILNGAVIGVAGTVLGNLLGLGGCWLLAHYRFVELPKDVFLVTTLPVRMDPINFLVVATVSVAICVVAALLPALLS